MLKSKRTLNRVGFGYLSKSGKIFQIRMSTYYNELLFFVEHFEDLRDNKVSRRFEVPIFKRLNSTHERGSLARVGSGFFTKNKKAFTIVFANWSFSVFFLVRDFDALRFLTVYQMPIFENRVISNTPFTEQHDISAPPSEEGGCPLGGAPACEAHRLTLQKGGTVGGDDGAGIVPPSLVGWWGGGDCWRQAPSERRLWRCELMAEFVLRDLENDFDEEPVDVGNFQYGNFQLVGHGKVTNVFCGKYMKFKGCLRVELHNRTTLDGVDYRGKVYVKPVYHSCDKPSCPICFKHGWAVREAKAIDVRLKESRRFGKAEHIVCSVPARDYGLSLDALRLKARKVLFKRGVVGGVLIWHAFRFALGRGWYWGPHFHVIGFILGGYSCRGCTKSCLGCSGFEAVTRKFNQGFRDEKGRYIRGDGWIVKVLGERKSVYHTAWYQLNHASIDVTKKRFHIATWFGVCSYRKLKLTVEKFKAVCPICGHDLEDIRYFGNRVFVLDRSSPEYKGSFFADFVEDGRVVWAVSASGSSKSQKWFE